MASVPGWRLTTVNGTRKAINPQGEVVAYNQYLNAQAQMSGFTSHSQFVTWRRKNQEYLGTFYGHTPGAKGKLGLGSETLLHYFRAFFETTLDNRIRRKRDVDRKAHGDLALLLEEVADRPKGATYDVGETPPP
jgi:hypothetical protein